MAKDRPTERPGESETPAERSEARRAARAGRDAPGTMIPARERRRTRAETGLMRLVATTGIIGIGTALGAILIGQNVAGWITGLAVSALTVVLAAVLWSSRRL
jgi:hypothetical protein